MTTVVLGIPGSLRAASYNRSLLRAAVEVQPTGMDIRVFEGLAAVPLYNADVEAQGDPEGVRAFKSAIESADALLISTAEYNYGVPGVLKNALDWASRPPGKSVLNHKPAAIIGASMGTGGTVRAQLALRQSFIFTETHAMLRPELLMGRAQDKFDGDGRLTDDSSRKQLASLLVAFEQWIARMSTR
jgi:chromate reductase